VTSFDLITKPRHEIFAREGQAVSGPFAQFYQQRAGCARNIWEATSITSICSPSPARFLVEFRFVEAGRVRAERL
jgi:hypothetical protein